MFGRMRQAAVGGLTLALLAGGAARAAAPAEADRGSFGVSTGYSGAYLFRGFKFADSGIATEAHAGYQVADGLTLGGSYWDWQSLKKRQGNSTQSDLHVGYAPQSLPVSFTAGWIYYGGKIHGRIREVYGSVTATKLPASPTLTVYYGYTRPYHEVFVGSAGYTWPLSHRLTYTAWGAVGFNVGKAYAPDGFAVAIEGNTLSYQLGRGFSAVATLDLHVPNGKYNNSLRVVPGARIAYGTTF